MSNHVAEFVSRTQGEGNDPESLSTHERLRNPGACRIEVLERLPAIGVDFEGWIRWHGRWAIHRRVVGVVGIRDAVRTLIPQLVRSIVMPELKDNIAGHVTDPARGTGVNRPRATNV